MSHTFPILALSISVVLSYSSHCVAEKPDMSPAQLEKTATHIVVGEVNNIYTSKERRGHYAYTHYVAELKIGKVEKGEGIEAGKLIYVRYWRRQFKGSGPPPTDTSGHRGLPDKGDNVRVYVAKNAYDGLSRKEQNNDGGFNVIGCNGFADPDAIESKK